MSRADGISIVTRSWSKVEKKPRRSDMLLRLIDDKAEKHMVVLAVACCTMIHCLVVERTRVGKRHRGSLVLAVCFCDMAWIIELLSDWFLCVQWTVGGVRGHRQHVIQLVTHQMENRQELVQILHRFAALRVRTRIHNPVVR